VSTTPFLKISDDVETALAEGRAVVALESTSCVRVAAYRRR
jgi:pseudouridine-5'-phosphate glycosidase